VLTAAATAQPLGLDEFAARVEQLAYFESEPFVAVAVSGGSDSLCLAILADRWARQRGGRICALSVDHRLRPESRAEIDQLGKWLAGRSIWHEILVWHGNKPATGIQEAARAARYRLMEEWCRAQGCLHLMIGHQREDQVETHWLRRDARSGPDGLAGMPAVRELDGCRILRPLLDIPKTRLVATLAAEGQPFISDPSNCNPVFARARLRQGAAASDPDGALSHIRRLGRERVMREHRCHALLARAVALHPAGFAVVDLDALLAAPQDLAGRALTALVTALGGNRYPPRRRSVDRLLQNLVGSARGGHVLGGHRFVYWRGHILVLRELAAAAPPARLAPGETLLWDRRFEVSLAAAAPPLRVGYLGGDGVAELRRQSPGSGQSELPPLIHPVLLGFWDDSGLAAVPALGYRRNAGMALLKLALRPVTCLSHASFAVV
jgi:tRNA(Ile)-lysidine synthase